jgi:hypothetical protein
MATYRSDTNEWMVHAKAGKRPYGMLDEHASHGTRVLSSTAIIGDNGGWIGHQDHVRQEGHAWWRVVNENSRVRRVQITANAVDGRIVWKGVDSRLDGTPVIVTIVVNRTTSGAEYFSERDSSAGFRVVDSGIEKVHSTVGDHSFDSEFVATIDETPHAPVPGGGENTICDREDTLDHWGDVTGLLEETDSLNIAKYVVVGDYVRYAPAAFAELRQAKDVIVQACHSCGQLFENFLVWGVAGEGKTFFLSEIARFSEIPYDLIDLSPAGDIPNAESLRARIERGGDASKPFLYILDEFDKRLSEEWLCPTVFNYLGVNTRTTPNVPNRVFVIVGSTMPNKDALVEAITSKKVGGNDLMTRIPHNVICVPPLSLEDRLLLFVKHVVKHGAEKGLKLAQVEKLAVAYVLSRRDHKDARWIADIAQRAVNRISPHQETLKYGHLFDPGVSDQYTFHDRAHKELAAMEGNYLYVDG